MTGFGFEPTEPGRVSVFPMSMLQPPVTPPLFTTGRLSSKPFGPLDELPSERALSPSAIRRSPSDLNIICRARSFATSARVPSSNPLRSLLAFPAAHNGLQDRILSTKSEEMRFLFGISVPVLNTSRPRVTLLPGCVINVDDNTQPTQTPPVSSVCITNFHGLVVLAAAGSTTNLRYGACLDIALPAFRCIPYLQRLLVG